MDVCEAGVPKRAGGVDSGGSVWAWAPGLRLVSWLLMAGAGASCSSSGLTHCTDPGGCKLPLVCHQKTNLCWWAPDAGSDAGETPGDAGAEDGADAGAADVDAGPVGSGDAGPALGADAGACTAGFKPVNGTCVDLDECALGGPSPCGVAASGCVNTQGSYRCTCVEGFAAPPLGGTCADVDECAVGTDTCDHDPMACTNTEGGFTCACPSGFEGNGRTSAGCLWGAPELASLTVSAGGLAPGFKGSTLEYALTLPPHETRASFTPAATYPTHALIKVEGVEVASGVPSAVSSFGLVPALRKVLVTSTDLTREREYRVSVRRAAPTYIKPGATRAFGLSFALSKDGATLAVPDRKAGRIYVYRRTGATWAFEAEVTGEHTQFDDDLGVGDHFGERVALSADGSVLAVGAPGESSGAKGVGGSQTDNSAPNSGAAYIFTRSGGTWSQRAFIKASNAEAGDLFGYHVALSSAGEVLVVNARDEDSGGEPEDNSKPQSGAVYFFSSSSGAWSQTRYLKAPSPAVAQGFGDPLALSGDGSTLAASIDFARVLVFKDGRFIPSVVEGAVANRGQDSFGLSLTLDEYGAVLAVGAPNDRSPGKGINGGMEEVVGLDSAGAVYLFEWTGSAWSRLAYVKASNTDASDYFGESVALSRDGRTLAVGAHSEASSTTGVDGEQSSNSLPGAGAVYVFTQGSSTWSQHAYVKATTPGREDNFGNWVALSGDGSMLVVAAPFEASPATGVNGRQEGADGPTSGAIYIY